MDNLIYTDFNSLNELKYEAAQDPNAAAPAAAKQFEGLFTQMMLKSMRAANKIFQPEGFEDSSQMDTYQEMYDQQLAQELSKGKGIGLAQSMLKHLQQLTPQDPSENNGSIAMTPLRKTGLPLIDMRLKQAQMVANTAIPDAAKSFVDKIKAHGFKNSVFSSPEDFLQTLLPYAKQAAAAVGLDPKLLLAQAALETGWGRSVAADGSGSSFNLFGIKAGSKWTGDRVVSKTHEYYNGQRVTENANFRSYGSWGESFNDFIQLLMANPRYNNVWQHAHDPKSFAGALQQSGYATDPAYAKKIYQIYHSDRMQNLTL